MIIEMTTDELTTQFETFHGALKSFILRMTASAQDTDDIVQDTYIKARAKINTFRGESSLKTWVFTIASNLANEYVPICQLSLNQLLFQTQCHSQL